MKVFVTGGTGFIGGEVVRQLRDRGDDVVCLVRSPEKAAKVDRARLRARHRRPRRRARRSARAWRAATRVDPRRGDVRGRDPGQAAPGDVRGQRRAAPSGCCGAALEAKIPKVVYVSTVGVFGNTHGKVVDETYEHPGKEFTSYYEETKLEAHQIAKRMIAEESLPCVIVQPGGVYGPGDTSQVADLLEQFFAGKLPLLPFPELGICLTHVEDIAGRHPARARQGQAPARPT